MSGGPQYPQVLQSMKTTGTLFNTYTTAKSILNPQDVQPFPADYLQQGNKLKIHAHGALSNIVTTPGTVVFQLMMGVVVAWSSGNIQLNATAHTLLPWWLDVELRLDSEGSGTSAKFLGEGVLEGIMFTNTAGQTDAVNTVGSFPVPATAPAVGTGWDSTAAQNFDLWAGFSISNAANGFQLYDYDLSQLKF